MSILYDFFRNANSIDSTRELYHPRPTHSQTIDTERLVNELREISGLSSSAVTAVLHGLNQALVRHLSEGDNVHIDGIGSFSISLTAPETTSPSATRASSIKIKSVNFRCDKELRDEVSQRATFVRDRFKTQSPEIKEADLIKQVAEYFKTNRSMTRQQFMNHTGLNHSTAIRRLSMLREQGYIANMSYDNHHPLYVATAKLLSSGGIG